MNSKYFLYFLIFFSSYSYSQFNGFSKFGIELGYLSEQPFVEAYSNNMDVNGPAINFGLFAEFPIFNKVELQSGFLTGFDVSNLPSVAFFKIPLLLKYYTSDYSKFYFRGGTEFIISNNKEYFIDNSLFSLKIGVGFDVNKKFSLGLDYSNSKMNYNPPLKINGLGLNIQYSFN